MRPITKIRIIYPAEGFADYDGDSPLCGGGGRESIVDWREIWYDCERQS